MVCVPVRSIIPSLKLGDYLSVQIHKPCSISFESFYAALQHYLRKIYSNFFQKILKQKKKKKRCPLPLHPLSKNKIKLRLLLSENQLEMFYSCTKFREISTPVLKFLFSILQRDKFL